jgi:hypothetical protein
MQPGGMVRWLEHNAPCTFQRHLLLLATQIHLLKEAQESGLPCLDLLGGEAAHIQKRMAGAATVGKNHDLVGRPQAQIHQCKLVLLRAIPADRHVVHRTPGRESKVEQVSHQLIEDHAISRRKTFKRCGRSEAFVEHQQLVQKGRPGSPVTNDEDRGLLEHASANASRKDQSLDKIKD